MWRGGCSRPNPGRPGTAPFSASASAPPGGVAPGGVAGVLFTTNPASPGIDIYLGIGAAPEGVLAAGELRCIGGQMQGRLILDTEAKRERAAKMGVSDPRKKYDMRD